MTRAQRHRDMLAAIEEFWRASGRDRLRARRYAQASLREWRFLYLDPERARLECDVRRSQEQRHMEEATP